MFSKLVLERPMAFIDLETTGNRYYADRIVEFSVLKIHPDGMEEFKSRRVNPEMPISRGAFETHGITNADLAGEPVFRQLAKSICDFIEDCDLSGFNILGFDLPLLEREFNRAGVAFSRDGRQVVDSMAIFHMMVPFDPGNPRNLAAAYQKYCGKELTNAHSAEADVRASAEILDAQLAAHAHLPCDAGGLCMVCLEHRKDFLDDGGRLVWREDGEAVFNFGKYKGRSIRDVVTASPDYVDWMRGSDFSPEVMGILDRALKGELPRR